MSIQFREVELPAFLRDEYQLGHLFLHSMPGRYEALADCLTEMGRQKIATIFMLSSREEVELKSPEYAKNITDSALPAGIELHECPIPDFSAPTGMDAKEFYFRSVECATHHLRFRKNILVHCGAGIGRTGMFAACVLIALGVPREVAIKHVRLAGSGAETADQRCLIAEYATRQMPSQ